MGSFGEALHPFPRYEIDSAARVVRDAGRELPILQETESTYCCAFMIQSEEVRTTSDSECAHVTPNAVTVLQCYRSYDTSNFIHREVVLDTGCDDSTICHTQVNSFLQDARASTMRIRGFDRQAQPLMADKHGTLKAFVSGLQTDPNQAVVGIEISFTCNTVATLNNDLMSLSKPRRRSFLITMLAVSTSTRPWSCGANMAYDVLRYNVPSTQSIATMCARHLLSRYCCLEGWWSRHCVSLSMT
eukprot:SAG31_NODE_1471_length_8213_cov_71.355065_2_plen_244_part_00